MPTKTISLVCGPRFRKVTNEKSRTNGYQLSDKAIGRVIEVVPCVTVTCYSATELRPQAMPYGRYVVMIKTKRDQMSSTAPTAMKCHVLHWTVRDLWNGNAWLTVIQRTILVRIPDK